VGASLQGRSLDAFQLLPEGVVVVTTDGNISYVNDRACALLGIDRSVLGEPFVKTVDLYDDAGNRCTDVVLAARRGDRVAERLLGTVVDGRRRPVALSGAVLEDGTIYTFRHAGRRERLDAARSDLVATVSHEIRSPLTSVKGFTRTLLAKWERFSDEQKRTMLETINADADRVTRLLTELLDVSRIDAGRVQLRKQIVDLRSAIPAVIEKAQHRPEGESRTLEADLPDDLPTVFADPDKVEQIITNLVENALQYAPESPVTVRARSDDGFVRVSVEDAGPGIHPDQLRRIFQKFGRGRENRRAGTGLGLYITRGIARAHGGDVVCQATPGGGATFHLTLPRTPPEVDAALDR